ncbi:MAG: hypothetical protein GXP42_08875 [Chloroflexi bacterium]|nr:hypothetical protein [Chloroflexota bacterium]
MTQNRSLLRQSKRSVSKMAVIEVDQSGRIEVLTENTALGFSNAIQASILISAPVKRKVSTVLRERGVRSKMISIRMFAASLFLLLENYLDLIEIITIDQEFPGWEPQIKGLLLSHIRERAPDFASEHIVFSQIGKKSPAHEVAWRTFRGKRTPEKKPTSTELLRFC